MKKIIIITLASLFIMGGTWTASAQQKKQPVSVEQMAQRRTDRMTEKLSLNEKQAKEVYEIMLESMKVKRELQEMMREARKEETKEIREVLTPEQFVQWKQMNAPKKDAPQKKGNK